MSAAASGVTPASTAVSPVVPVSSLTPVSPVVPVSSFTSVPPLVSSVRSGLASRGFVETSSSQAAPTITSATMAGATSP
jgi:hypothetical protein